MLIDLNTSEKNVTSRPVFTPGLVDLQKFMFSERYHLTASVLTRNCLSMMGLMLWITSFNRSRMSLSLLLLIAFLKVRAVYFKVDSTILGAFQCLQHVHHPLALSPPSISEVLRVHSPMKWVHPESLNVIAVC